MVCRLREKRVLPDRSGSTARWWSAALLAGVPLCTAAVATAAGETPYAGDLGQAIAATAIFLVLLVVLGRWAWKPIVAQLQQREQTVAERVRSAEKCEEQARDLTEEYKSRLDAARGEADRIMESSRKEAGDARDEIIELARAEARKAVRQAREEIERDRKNALRELQAVTAQVAADIAEQVLGRTLTPQEHQRLVDESLREIQATAAEQS